MEKDSFFKALTILVVTVIGIFFVGILVGISIGIQIRNKRVSLYEHIKNNLKIYTFSLAIFVSISHLTGISGVLAISVYLVLCIAFGVLITFLFDFEKLWKQQAVSISTKDFKNVNQSVFTNRIVVPGDNALIGYSMKTMEPIFLSKSERVKHTVIAGSTGSGKTTTLKALFIDAMKNDYPVLIIDPKGNIETINEFRSLAKKYSPREKEFEIFSLISPQDSYHYNPLKRGSSIQIKDRIMTSLEWSEQYYKNQANSFLGQAIFLFKELGVEISISNIHNLLKDKKFSEELQDLISKQQPLSKREELNNLFRKLPLKDPKLLDNLTSQLSDLDNRETGFLLKTDLAGNREINLLEVIKYKKIAYFQLNTMAYGFSSKAMGKLILSDLKSLASEIHGGLVATDKPFFPIFVDEFGSFCSAEFIEMQKMCRDVNFALHLFFQSLADLEVVSPEFKSQVQQNCITKLVLRTDEPEEVEFWSSVAGTIETKEESFQYKNFLGFRLKTGMGNSRNSRVMKVEHDVFKQLNVGQSVLIRKSPSKEDLIQLWNPT